MRRILRGWWLMPLIILPGCGGGAGDSVAPQIAAVTVSRQAGQYEVHVEAQVTDAGSGVKTVTALGTDVGPSERPVAMERVGSTVYAADLPETVIRVKVIALDSAGNQAQSQEQTVPPPPPAF